MTVTVAYSPLTYNCNGSTTAFSVTWPFFLSSDLVVTHITSTGVETALVLNTDYTVSGGRDSTTGLPAVGTVTTIATYASGVKVRITRSTPRTQSSSFTTAGAFAAKTIEAMIDRVHMIAEEGTGGPGVQDIDGSALRLETGGATDYWNGEDYIARGFADGVEDTDLVTKSQLDAVSDQITAPSGDVIDFSTRASAIDTSIGASIGAIRTRGYTTSGDGGGALYKRAGSEPSHAGKFQSADGAWWEIAETRVNVLAFGAKGDNSNDDATAIQNAITYIESLTTPTEGPNGEVVGPAGRTYKIGSGLTLSKPSIFHMYGYLNYTPTTGRAITVNSTAPSAGRNTGFDIWLAGIRAVNGNSSQPTSVNASGCTGLEIRNMQFSRVHVGKVIAFTKHGVYFNCSGDSYSGQHIQDNEFSLGEIAYNGAGIKLLSDDAATGAFQVNHIKVQNAFTNYYNLEIDDASNDDSSNNIWDITAIDAPAAGGTCVRMLSGNYNQFRIGYMDGTLSLAATTNDNYFWIGNDTTTGLTISDSGENWIETAGTNGARRIYSPKYTYENGALAIDGAFTPITDATHSIGSASKRWNKLFLKTAGEVDFDNGNVRLVHSTDLLTLRGRYEIYRDSAESYLMEIEQDGTGDAAVHLLLTGEAEATFGIDNSDSNKFKVSASGDLGTSTMLTLDMSSGDLTPAGHSNLASGKKYQINGTDVLTGQGAAVANATGAGDVVAQLNALLAQLRAIKVIAT